MAAFAGNYRLLEDNDSNRIEISLAYGRLVYQELTAVGEMVRKTPLYAIDDKTFDLADVPVMISFANMDSNANATLSFGVQAFTMVRKD